MPVVRTIISVAGFDEAEVRAGLDDLLDEFRHRPWMQRAGAYWDGATQRLIVTVECTGDNPQIEGGDGGANLDEVWDCVIACLHFSSEGIRFEVEESVVLPDE